MSKTHSPIKPKRNKTVYRVEHESTRLDQNELFYAGPYDFSEITTVEDWCEDDQYHGDDKKHPCVYGDVFLKNDVPNKWQEKYVCGFLSLKSLKNWFSPTELQNLTNAGFVIRSYTITEDQILRGKKQILFWRKKD